MRKFEAVNKCQANPELEYHKLGDSMGITFAEIEEDEALHYWQQEGYGVRKRQVAMKCNCDDWAKNIDILNGPLLQLNARNPQQDNSYNGKIFVYCPWCAAKLVEDK